MAKKKIKAISLFSGAMGLDIGLEQTGRIQLLACLEKEPAFCGTIRRNQAAGNLPRSLRVFEGNVEDISPMDVLRSLGLRPGELDLLVGGPPCQSFSTAGKRRTVQDPRGTLLWQFLNFVEVMRPRMFLLENVRGLLSAAIRHRPIEDRPDRGGAPLTPDEQPGSVVRLFASDLEKLEGASYSLDCFEVNAVNYGAPQLRERALFFGNRYNARVDFPSPTHGPSDIAGLKPWRTLRDALGNLDEKSPVLMDFSPRKKAYISKVPPGSNWRSLPERLQRESMGRAWHAKGGRSGWWRRLSYDLPCPTLVTMPNHASTALCHPDSVRALSVREYARIQEFPDRWEICGSPQQQYTQIGNAVPVRLGFVAGNAIATIFDTLTARKWRAFPKSDDGPRRVYLASHVRTRSWFKDGKTMVFKDGKANPGVSHAGPITRRRETLLNEEHPSMDRLLTEAEV